jgi:hypothetical protein
MAAFLCECGHVPAWPPDEQAVTSQDQKHLAMLVDALGWHQSEYEDAIESTKALMRTPRFVRAYKALGAALTTRPFLDRKAIERVIGLQHKASGVDALARVRDIEAHWQDQRARAYELELEAA